MSYQPGKLFDLPKDNIWPGDERYDGQVKQPYLFGKETAVAVDVALATNRPLLVAGPPGSGKSRLAPAMAGLLKARYLTHTFTSRSRLGELTSDLDHLRRLHEAQTWPSGEDTPPLPREWAYREPGVFWWAFDPTTAALRGGTQAQVTALGDRFRPPEPPANAATPGDLVMLLDEIDKADPDLPNDLLGPLDRMSFQVPDGPLVQAPTDMKLLVIITTNGERDLPPAFLRRCVSLVLKHPSRKQLMTIGRKHYPNVSESVLTQVTKRFVRLRQQAHDEGLRLPSTSEYLDAVRAARDLELPDDDTIWSQVETASMLKRVDWVDELPEDDE
jgi:MoxR-like ATPase